MISKLGVFFPQIIPSLIVCLLLAACSNVDSKSLQEGFKKYTAQQVPEAQTIADQYITANPNSGDIDQAYYLRGICRMTLGSRVGAASDLRLALAKTSRADLRSKASRALGDIAYDQQQWADAVKSYQAALDNPALLPVAATYLNYRIGAALQCLGEWAKAEPWFAKVVAANNVEELFAAAVRRMYARSFAIQYGAFQERAGAQALLAQVQAAGIAAGITSEVRTVNKQNKLWFLVQSGSHSTWSEAAAARNRVPAKFPAVIVP